MHPFLWLVWVCFSIALVLTSLSILEKLVNQNIRKRYAIYLDEHKTISIAPPLDFETYREIKYKIALYGLAALIWVTTIFVILYPWVRP